MFDILVWIVAPLAFCALMGACCLFGRFKKHRIFKMTDLESWELLPEASVEKHLASFFDKKINE